MNNKKGTLFKIEIRTAKLLDEDSCHLQFILYPDTEGEILLPLFWKHTVRVEAYLVKVQHHLLLIYNKLQQD